MASRVSRRAGFGPRTISFGDRGVGFGFQEPQIIVNEGAAAGIKAIVEGDIDATVEGDERVTLGPGVKASVGGTGLRASVARGVKATVDT